jgi:hypothetical protein
LADSNQRLAASRQLHKKSSSGEWASIGKMQKEQ